MDVRCKVPESPRLAHNSLYTRDGPFVAETHKDMYFLSSLRFEKSASRVALSKESRARVSSRAPERKRTLFAVHSSEVVCAQEVPHGADDARGQSRAVAA